MQKNCKTNLNSHCLHINASINKNPKKNEYNYLYSFFLFIDPLYLVAPSTACAAANLAIGTLNGEQDT